MLVVLCLIAAVLPLTLVEGMKPGWADTNKVVYFYDTIMNGGPDLGIQYEFTSRFSRICCEGLACESRRGCGFVDIGCGFDANGVPFRPRPLRWELRDVSPAMRCYDSRGTEAYYSYTASVVPID